MRRRVRKREAKTEDDDWTKVQLGILATLGGIGILLVAYVLGLLDLAIGSAGVTIHFALTVVAFLMLAGRAAFAAGDVLCLFGPSQNHARIWATASLVVICFSLLASCLGGVSFAYNGPNEGFGAWTSFIGIHKLRWLSGVAAVSVLFHGLVFLFYLRAVALTLNEGALAKRIIFLAALSGAAVLVNCGAFCVAIPATVQDVIEITADSSSSLVTGLNFLGTALNALGGLFMLGMAAWYVVTLLQVRQAIVNAALD
jgi:hypothetical protein